MRKFLLVVAAASLAACGGGGDDSPSNNSGIVRYSNGDSYTFSVENTPLVGAAPTVSSYRYTRTIRNPKANYEHERLTTYSTAYRWSEALINAENFRTEETQSSRRCTSTAGQTNPGFSIELGKTWNSQFITTCATNSESSSSINTSQGKVIGREKYTTSAGTFDSFKVEISESEKTEAQTIETENIAWFDVKSAQVVASDVVVKITPNGASAPSQEYKVARRLTSFDVRNHSQSKASAERFAGSWGLTWVGSNAGSCNIQIALSGSLSGSCETGQAPYISFSVGGNVTADGNIMVTSNNGAVFSGSFEDPAFARGNWKNSGISGTWTAGHR